MKRNMPMPLGMSESITMVGSKFKLQAPRSKLQIPSVLEFDLESWNLELGSWILDLDLLSRPLVHRLRGVTEVERRVDERDVRERLREVADLAAQPRVVLLGQQADVVAQGEQPLEKRPGFVQAAEHHVGIG